MVKSNKCALITGASAGLGAEFAKLFAADGHSLVLVARRQERLDELASSLRMKYPVIDIETIPMDLGTPDAGSNLFAVLQERKIHIDYLVNNAGFGSNGKFAELPILRELNMIDLNIKTLVELTGLLLPGMIKNRHGGILNVGSTAGFQPGPQMATYYASKAFVNSFSEALSEELLGTGVSCTLLAPGATATEFADVSGISESGLFKFVVADALNVALLGYRGFFEEKRIVIPGLLNQILHQGLRIMPRSLVTKFTNMINTISTPKNS